MVVKNRYIGVVMIIGIIYTVAMITFGSSTFNGSESSGVIMTTVIISGGIVSSRDISVPITFTESNATGKDEGIE